LDQQLAETLYLTSISLSELLIEIAIMPHGKRKAGVSSALDNLMSRLFDTRILSFDREAAVAYSVLVSKARAAGRTVSMPDAQIAAIASVHGFTIATRDLRPFKSLGLPVIDPWDF
jgi:predicted nucleic acid-binding protein